MTSEIGRRVGINNWSKLLMDSILKHCRHTGRGCWKLGKIAKEIILKIFKNVFFLIFFSYSDSGTHPQVTKSLRSPPMLKIIPKSKKNWLLKNWKGEKTLNWGRGMRSRLLGSQSCQLKPHFCKVQSSWGLIPWRLALLQLDISKTITKNT